MPRAMPSPPFTWAAGPTGLRGWPRLLSPVSAGSLETPSPAAPFHRVRRAGQRLPGGPCCLQLFRKGRPLTTTPAAHPHPGRLFPHSLESQSCQRLGYSNPSSLLLGLGSVLSNRTLAKCHIPRAPHPQMSYFQFCSPKPEIGQRSIELALCPFKSASYCLLKAFSPCERFPLIHPLPWVQALLEPEYTEEIGAGWGGGRGEGSCQASVGATGSHLPPLRPQQQAEPAGLGTTRPRKDLEGGKALTPCWLLGAFLAL